MTDTNRSPGWRRALALVSFHALLGLSLLPATSVAESADPEEKERIEARLLEVQARLEALKPSRDRFPTEWAELRIERFYLSSRLGGYLPGPARDAGAGHEPVPKTVPGGVVPPAPVRTVPSTQLFTNSTVTAIADAATTLSMLEVAMAEHYVWDVNVEVFVTHTYSSDLELTLMSPSGTAVVLTTDNGGSLDNVFNGTLFDDDAPGPVSDHVFTDMVTATPLVPEGALDALQGEDPNGTWTLEVVDVIAGDVGSLNQWSLEITALANPPVATEVAVGTDSTPQAIPDLGTTMATIEMANLGPTVCRVLTSTQIDHTFEGDLDMTLTSPDGTEVTLSTDNGTSTHAFADVEWADDALDLVTDAAFGVPAPASLVPEGALGAFLGEDPNGTWTLEIQDDQMADTGTLDSWDLTVTTCESGVILGTTGDFTGPGSGSHDGTLDENGTPSTCQGKAFPGVVSAGTSLAHQTFGMMHDGPASCYKITVQAFADAQPCAGMLNVAVYAPAFDSGNLASNYLGDLGGFPLSQPKAFYVPVPADSSFSVVALHNSAVGESCDFSLQVEESIFVDGFESGDVSLWTAAAP